MEYRLQLFSSPLIPFLLLILLPLLLRLLLLLLLLPQLLTLLFSLPLLVSLLHLQQLHHPCNLLPRVITLQSIQYEQFYQETETAVAGYLTTLSKELNSIQQVAQVAHTATGTFQTQLKDTHISLQATKSS